MSMQRTLTFDYPSTVDDNEDRAALVLPYYDDFADHHYGGREAEERDDPGTIIGDLIADLLHVARSIGADPDDVVERAMRHFTEEEDEEATDASVEDLLPCGHDAQRNRLDGDECRACVALKALEDEQADALAVIDEEISAEYGIVVRCEDGVVRHKGGFDNRLEAERWATFGHACTTTHTYEGP